MPPKVISIPVSEYTVLQKPDYLNIGRKVDEVIEKLFGDGKYVYRVIGLDDHPGLTLDELVDIILKSGTDKYDPARKSVCHEQFCVYDYDIQAGSFEIRNAKIVIEPTDRFPSLFGDTVYDFYEHTPLDRGYPVRIDLLVLYDPDKMELAKLIKPESPKVKPELEKYLYRFKDRKNKRDALLGIVKVLRY
jgi:hypothetical protein